MGLPRPNPYPPDVLISTTGPRSAHLVAGALLGCAALFSSPAAAQDFAVPFSTQPTSMLSVGDTVSVTYELEETGGTSAGPVSVGFVIQDPAGTDAFLLYEDMVPSISAFGFVSRTMTFAVPSGVDGTWLAGLVADPWDAFVETDENDNVFVFNNMLTIGGGTPGGTITVVTETLPAAQVGAPFTATLRQSGATAPSWYVSAGSLPSGLSLSASGQISGTPSAPGSFSFSATAEQTGYTPGTGSFVITVTETTNQEITVSPTALPQARVGVPFSALLQASGGTPPYGYQVINGPAWLTTVGAGAEAGRMSGTPDGVGDYSMTVFVVDSTNVSAMAQLTLSVIESGPLTVNSTLPAAVTGKPYEGQVVSGGIPPYTIALASGALPAGLTIDTNGALTGVPSQAGSFPFEVQVTDSMGASASGSFTVDVTQLTTLAIASTEIVVYTNGDAMAPLVAMGGVPPYSWSMIGGVLPAGLSFDSTQGKIVGRASMIGSEQATFSVSDAEGTTVTGDVVVKVAIFIPQGTRNGPERRTGCICVERANTGVGGFFVVLLALGALRRRRRSA